MPSIDLTVVLDAARALPATVPVNPGSSGQQRSDPTFRDALAQASPDESPVPPETSRDKPPPGEFARSPEPSRRPAPSPTPQPARSDEGEVVSAEVPSDAKRTEEPDPEGAALMAVAAAAPAVVHAQVIEAVDAALRETGLDLTAAGVPAATEISGDERQSVRFSIDTSLVGAAPVEIVDCVASVRTAEQDRFAADHQPQELHTDVELKSDAALPPSPPPELLDAFHVDAEAGQPVSQSDDAVAPDPVVDAIAGLRGEFTVYADTGETEVPVERKANTYERDDRGNSGTVRQIESGPAEPVGIVAFEPNAPAAEREAAPVSTTTDPATVAAAARTRQTIVAPPVDVSRPQPTNVKTPDDPRDARRVEGRRTEDSAHEAGGADELFDTTLQQLAGDSSEPAEDGGDRPSRSASETGRNAARRGRGVSLSFAADIADRGIGAGSGAGNSPMPELVATPRAGELTTETVRVGDVVPQVVRAVQWVASTGSALRVQLDPPELGRLQIDISVSQGTVTARLEAESVSTQRLLQENLSHLRDALVQQGVTLDRLVVEHSRDGRLDLAGRSFAQSEQQSQGQERSPQERPPEDLRGPHGTGGNRRGAGRSGRGRLDVQV